MQYQLWQSEKTRGKQQKELSRSISGFRGGLTHTGHNTTQNAVPTEVEVFVLNKYFHIYTVCVTQIREFYEFTEIEYCTRLTIWRQDLCHRCQQLKRFLQIVHGLKKNFISQEILPASIKNFFW